jgi:uncharacterized surface protein with fasciclin (FAS1) repeats
MTKKRTLLAVLAVAALAVAAVGSSASAAGRQQPNIVGTASSSKQFSTLSDLITRAGLVSTLNKKGPYTVFAPTNAAFAKVPKQTLNALLADKAKLRAVLLYHVVPGNVTAKDVVKLSSAKTAGGQRVDIRVAGSNVFVNDAKVTTADVKASNGVIHVVNRVLIPAA